jgi:CIC family chloride channel protein
VSFKALLHSRRFIVILAAMGVGVLGGIGAVVFKLMIDLSTYFFFDILLPIISLRNSPYNYSVVLLPTLGAVIVGVIIAKYAIEAKGHGIPQVMECMAFECGRMRYRVAAAKIIASSITIGSGGSAGKEGPIGQIGATFGSMSGQLLKLPDRDVELLVVCGLASGIAATFNAPLGGAIFGLEILFRRFEIAEAIPVLLSCVLGTLVARLFLGDFIPFATPIYGIPQPLELLTYAFIGVGFGVLSAIWVKFFYSIEGTFDWMKRVPFVLRVALGGLVTGIVGLPLYTLALSQFGDKTGYGIYGIGYEGIQLLLAGLLPITLILVLALAKMFCTSFTLGSGASGGLLLPTFYIGAMFGGVTGIIFYSLSPSLISQPYAVALVGAATLFAGAYGTPIASIIFIPEMSLNYGLILPLMLACSLSHLTARRLLHGSTINTLALERKGIDLAQLTNQMSTDVLSRIQVRDAMTKRFVTVAPKTSAEQLSRLISTKRQEAYPVIENGKLVGSVDYRSIIEVSPQQLKLVQVEDIMTRAETVSPEVTLSEALRRMYVQDVASLVVIDPVDRKPLGLLTHKNVVRGYEAARKKRHVSAAERLK